MQDCITVTTADCREDDFEGKLSTTPMGFKRLQELGLTQEEAMFIDNLASKARILCDQDLSLNLKNIKRQGDYTAEGDFDLLHDTGLVYEGICRFQEELHHAYPKVAELSIFAPTDYRGE